MKNISNRADFLKFKLNESEDLKSESNNPHIEEIRRFYDDKCPKSKSFKVELKEVLKASENIDSKKDYVIPGMDPIIEIVKLFNRAYKIYMTNVITKKTSGPSPGTLMEYTPMNGGSGPWRNNKLFNQWEDGVMDVLKDRKYQVIFNKKTKLKVGDELRPGKGAELRKFMTDLLDGNSLYSMSSGGSGSQAKFLDKYFGEVDVKDVDFGLEKGEVSKNIETQKKVEEGLKKLTFKKSKSGGGVGQIFAVIGKNESGDIRKRFFFIFEGKEEDKLPYVMVYTYGFGPIWSIIKQSDNLSVDRGEFPEDIKENQVVNMLDGKPYIKNITKINKSLIEVFRVGGKVKIDHVVSGKVGDIVTEELTIDGVYFLNDENGVYKFPNDMKSFKTAFGLKDFPSYLNTLSDKVMVSKI